jgi:hypothetical protein
MQVAKKGQAFFIYALPMLDVEPRQHEIPSQYQEFKDMFKKKNVNTLLKHWPYDYVIDQKKVHSLCLGSFITCGNMNLQHFVSTLMKTLKRVSFNIPSPQ